MTLDDTLRNIDDFLSEGDVSDVDAVDFKLLLAALRKCREQRDLATRALCTEANLIGISSDFDIVCADADAELLKILEGE